MLTLAFIHSEIIAAISSEVQPAELNQVKSTLAAVEQQYAGLTFPNAAVAEAYASFQTGAFAALSVALCENQRPVAEPEPAYLTGQVL
jgi:hypothetical protein